MGLGLVLFWLAHRGGLLTLETLLPWGCMGGSWLSEMVSVPVTLKCKSVIPGPAGLRGFHSPWPPSCRKDGKMAQFSTPSPSAA